MTIKINKQLPIAALVALAVAAGCTSADSGTRTPEPTLTPQQSGTANRLQAISVVNESVVWASGVGGTFVRTTDGGETWTATVVPGADSLQFRDVEAIDADTAYLLSSGSGASSRIYKTVNGGLDWTLQFTNPDEEGFYDCMAFWDSRHGAVYGDEVDGSFVILTTSDGETWNRVPATNLPDVNPGEGGFAASGTCLIALGDSVGWIGTGASQEARVLRTTDRGISWTVQGTPIEIGTGASGIGAVAFHDELLGAVAGGEMDPNPVARSDNVAATNDGGVTWALGGRTILPGGVFGLAAVPGAGSPTLVAVGPGGADYSTDNGITWTQLDTLNYWSVAFASPSSGWAVGPEGRITKIKLY